MTDTRPDPASSHQKDGFQLADTQRTLPILLLRAREAVMERFRPLLAQHDISEQQWRVIRVLQETGEMDASHLAARACILPPSLTRILRTLESRGLIAVRKDDKDARRSLSHLTEAGQALIDRVAPSSVAIYQDIESRAAAERIDALLDELDHLINALNTPDS